VSSRKPMTSMEAIPNTLTSIKGIGPVYSAGILSEIGSINRFKDQASLAKYAGLSWSRYQSGNFDADKTHLINSGNRYIRYYLIEAANLARRHDPELKRFYVLKYRETLKTPHKRALALTARKFVRLVYALLRDQRLYSPPRVRQFLPPKVLQNLFPVKRSRLSLPCSFSHF
jgi:transposase